MPCTTPPLRVHRPATMRSTLRSCRRAALRLPIALVLAGAAGAPLGAQAVPPAATTSVLVGAFEVKRSALLLAKVERTFGRWALLADVTHDAVDETWAPSATRAGAEGEYRLIAGSASVRRYTRPGGRGLFVDVGAGVARASLTTIDDAGSRATRRATLPMGTVGLGGRIGMGRLPLFVELGLRGAVPLVTRHLYTDAAPPAGSTNEAVTYRSWYLGAGKAAAQAYVGFGFRR